MSEKLRTAIYDKDNQLDSLPVTVANVICQDTELSYEQKKEAIQIVRRWLDYVKEYNVTSENLYVLQSHLGSFASDNFPTENTGVALDSRNYCART